MRFQLGQVVATAAVHDDMVRDNEFAELVARCLCRHANGDWGQVCDEDKTVNDAALKHGNRVLSAYTIDPAKGESKGYGDNTLWIITEADRSSTTVLYPEEY